MGKNHGELFSLRFPPKPDKAPSEEDFKEGREILDRLESREKATKRKFKANKSVRKSRLTASDILNILKGGE